MTRELRSVYCPAIKLEISFLEILVRDLEAFLFIDWDWENLGKYMQLDCVNRFCLIFWFDIYLRMITDLIVSSWSDVQHYHHKFGDSDNRFNFYQVESLMISFRVNIQQRNRKHWDETILSASLAGLWGWKNSARRDSANGSFCSYQLLWKRGKEKWWHCIRY